jgi:hypothetical protein
MRADGQTTLWTERNVRLWRILLCGFLVLTGNACGHGGAHERPAVVGSEDSSDGVRVKGSTVQARILALMARGEFAEAQALIAEASAGGLITREAAVRLSERIAALNTKLGDIPASIQRVDNFPSQLKNYTLFEIRRMLQRNDFSLATKAQLNMAKKLIQEQTRLMDD